jgi:hypothetical protein
MNASSPRLSREAALTQTDALLAASPDAVDAHFRRACLLVQLGRVEEAKDAYLEVLSRAPTHFDALNDLANLLAASGAWPAACSLYRQAVKHYPANSRGHVNLGNLLLAMDQAHLAWGHYAAALSLAPDLADAHRGMAALLAQSGDETGAARHREQAFRQQPVLTLPYCGDGSPVELLVLASASGGVIPMRHHFDPRVFQVSLLFVEFQEHVGVLPAHSVIVNTIGDADLCGPALEAALQVVSRTDAPVVNHPAKVLWTGRAANVRSLGTIPHVITPQMAPLPRACLAGHNGPDLLAEHGFGFPVLLRAPGYHTGHFFLRVENEQDLAAAAASLPGDEALAIQFLDARSRDGKIRKYRVMMIGGVLYPLHVAIAHDWKIHYFTAEMADHPEHRAEDAAFLEDMAAVLGPRAVQGLEEISRTLGLDYGGMDFSLSEDGEILLFEANATMVVRPPDGDPRWDYRRPAVQRILDSLHRLLMQCSTDVRSCPAA